MKKKITCMKSILMIVIIIGFIIEIAIAQTAPTIPIPSQQQLTKPFQKRGIFNGPMLNMPERQNVPSVGVGAIKMLEGQNRPSNWLTLGCDSITGNVMINRMPLNQQEDFLNQTVELRKQMIAKRFDYIEALRSPKTTFQNLAEIEKGMLELRIKILEKVIFLKKQ